MPRHIRASLGSLSGVVAIGGSGTAGQLLLWRSIPDARIPGSPRRRHEPLPLSRYPSREIAFPTEPAAGMRVKRAALATAAVLSLLLSVLAVLTAVTNDIALHNRRALHDARALSPIEAALALQRMSDRHGFEGRLLEEGT